VQSYLEDLLPRRREIIYNGLFSEEELVALGNSWRGPEDPGEKRLLFVGRLTEIKGLQVVLDALKGLDTYPWVLDVLGEGPRQEDYLRKVKQEGWESRVFFHGFRENPGEWMQRSSCLLFPSLQEGMGRVFLEALARGVPVFASRIPALEEMVPGEDLLPPGDSETWRGMLRGFFEGSRKAPLFKPLRMPTREAMINATEALYREILGQR
jgi:glycosyltransferase involved in cell wall biosynthesis